MKTKGRVSKHKSSSGMRDKLIHCKHHFAFCVNIALVLITLLSFTVQVTTAAMALPDSKQSITYEASVSPVIDSGVLKAKPMGIGTVAASGSTLSLHMSVDQFSGPVDIYLAISAAGNLYIIKSDNSIHLLSEGLSPWKSDRTTVVDEKLYGDIPTISLPVSSYTIYVLVTPVGNLDSYYLWITGFEIKSSPSSYQLIVGPEGISAWDALSQTEKSRVISWNSLFIHQSVGQDIEGGAADNGFKPEYFGPGARISATNLYGGLFEGISNGDPVSKFGYFKSNVLANRDILRLAIFKFGYADIETTTLVGVQSGYKAMVDELKSNGIRLLHITPPLVYDVAYNSPKMQLRDWMKTTFPNDVIFDLQDIESRTGTTGNRCEQNGIWQICSDIRSTTSCPSNGQGVDTAGQGHLCASVATKVAKAFLYAVYLAGK